MTKRESLLEALEILGDAFPKPPRIAFVFAKEDDGGVFETIENMIEEGFVKGEVRVTLYEEEGREDHVIEVVEVWDEDQHVVLSCQRGRPLEKEDRPMGQRTFHRSEFTTSNLR